MPHDQPPIGEALRPPSVLLSPEALAALRETLRKSSPSPEAPSPRPPETGKPSETPEEKLQKRANELLERLKTAEVPSIPHYQTNDAGKYQQSPHDVTPLYTRPSTDEHGVTTQTTIFIGADGKLYTGTDRLPPPLPIADGKGERDFSVDAPGAYDLAEVPTEEALAILNNPELQANIDTLCDPDNKDNKDSAKKAYEAAITETLNRQLDDVLEGVDLEKLILSGHAIAYLGLSTESREHTVVLDLSSHTYKIGGPYAEKFKERLAAALASIAPDGEYTLPTRSGEIKGTVKLFDDDIKPCKYNLLVTAAPIAEAAKPVKPELSPADQALADAVAAAAAADTAQRAAEAEAQRARAERDAANIEKAEKIIEPILDKLHAKLTKAADRVTRNTFWSKIRRSMSSTYGQSVHKYLRAGEFSAAMRIADTRDEGAAKNLLRDTIDTLSASGKYPDVVVKTENLDSGVIEITMSMESNPTTA